MKFFCRNCYASNNNAHASIFELTDVHGSVACPRCGSSAVWSAKQLLETALETSEAPQAKPTIATASLEATSDVRAEAHSAKPLTTLRDTLRDNPHAEGARLWLLRNYLNDIAQQWDGYLVTEDFVQTDNDGVVEDNIILTFWSFGAGAKEEIASISCRISNIQRISLPCDAPIIT